VFYGDVFAGRVCTVPAPMRNGDFKLEDMNSSNAWIKTAAAENFQCVNPHHFFNTNKIRLGLKHFFFFESVHWTNSFACPPSEFALLVP